MKEHRGELEIREKEVREKEKQKKQKMIQRLKIMLDGIPSPTCLISDEFEVLDQNEHMKELFCNPADCPVISRKEKMPEIPIAKEQILETDGFVNWEQEVNQRYYSIWWMPLGMGINLYYAMEITKYKEIEKNLTILSNTDSLTGLKNRHFFHQCISNEIIRSDRYLEPLSLLMFDLDHFKYVNDSFGHPMGDQVLKKTAEVVSDIIRKSDVIARVGGEEFMILLPQTELVGAMDLAEKIRYALENIEHKTVGVVTASFGVVQRTENESEEDLYAHVDEAMYQAKAMGRNCIVSFGIENRISHPMAMARLEWNISLESGNKELDRQHKELVDIGNSLIYLSFSKAEQKRLEMQLKKLLRHIVHHFEYEERLQAEIGYDFQKEHTKEHQILLEKALTVKASYESGTMKSSDLFSFFLDEVVVGHMQMEDKKFYPYLKRNTLA